MVAQVAPVARERRSPLFEFLSRLRREKPLGAVAGTIVLLMLLIGIFADFLAPYGMNDLNLPDRLTPPSGKYLLGADHLGRDVLSRIIFGARTSVIIGLSGAAVSVVVAVLIGMTGYVGGKLDLFAQRVVDAWMAFPGLLVLITVMSMLGKGALQVIIVLGILGGIGNSRVARSAVMVIKENLYITAAEAIGARGSRTIRTHVLPNLMAPLIVIFTINLGWVIVTEAALGFLGLGLPPDVATWGGMLSWEGRRYMAQAPGLAFWPGLTLSVVVWAINMFGDAPPRPARPEAQGRRRTLWWIKENEASSARLSSTATKPATRPLATVADAAARR